jgi:hypothetical protein
MTINGTPRGRPHRSSLMRRDAIEATPCHKATPSLQLKPHAWSRPRAWLFDCLECPPRASPSSHPDIRDPCRKRRWSGGPGALPRFPSNPTTWYVPLVKCGKQIRLDESACLPTQMIDDVKIAPPCDYAVFRYTGSDGTSGLVGSSSGLVLRMISPQNNPIRPIEPAVRNPAGISGHVRG